MLRFQAVRGLGFKGLRQRTASRAPPRRAGLPRVRGLEFGDHDIGLGTLGLGFGAWHLGFNGWGLRCRVWVLGFGVWGLGFRV